MARLFDPLAATSLFRQEIREAVAARNCRIKLVGFLVTGNGPSLTYADYTRAGCSDVNIDFELREASRLQIEDAIEKANVDPSVHGIMVYYPVFRGERDRYLKDIVDPRKDIEGMHSQWVRMLYRNMRFLDEAQSRKAILPCTPLAVLKLVEAAGWMDRHSSRPLSGKTITIFNRSEVVGRPLAAMMANDGGLVYSFDVDGALLCRDRVVEETCISRAEALAQSDIVITGVPSRDFPRVRADEIQQGSLCVNFSTCQNFEDDVAAKAGCFVPRVGPMTVTMALRNTLRLYDQSRLS